MKNISVIVCAFNEEKTIAKVLRTIAKNHDICEIIVINDGSDDGTAIILENLKDKLNLKVIELSENKGKGYAMATGVEQAKEEIIVFIDADISYLTSEHIDSLIYPILRKEADMVLGQPSETLINYKINPFKSFTGERALLKEDILPILEKIKKSKFGVETLINLFYKANGKRVKYIVLPGLIHPTKFKKTSTLKATKEYVNEGHEIALTALSNYELILQSLNNKFKNIEL